MKRLISLGMNCEVSFQIKKYCPSLYASLFSWAFVINDDLFLQALDNIDDVFSNGVHFHLPTDDMFMDEKYQITFHGRTSKLDMLDKEGNIVNREKYDEALDELISRLAHLKSKFKTDLMSADEKVYIKKIMIEPSLEEWGGEAHLFEIICSLKKYFSEYSSNSTLVVVVEKKYLSDSILKLEDKNCKIRCVNFWAPVSDTQYGADNESWEKIIKEFM